MPNPIARLGISAGGGSAAASSASSAAAPAEARRPAAPRAPPPMPGFRPTEQRASVSLSTAGRSKELPWHRDERMIGQSKQQLAYQFILQEAGQSPTPEQVKMLEQGQQAIDQTKADMHLGRGNVGADKRRTKFESQVHAAAGDLQALALVRECEARGLEKSTVMTVVSEAVGAEQMGAGVCRTMAAVTLMNLIKPDQPFNPENNLYAVASRSEDHVFNTILPKSGQTGVVADAWASPAPAVLETHSRFGSNREKLELRMQIADAETAQNTLNFYNAVKGVVDNCIPADLCLSFAREELTDKSNHYKNFVETPVLSEGFLEQFDGARKNPTDTMALIRASGFLRSKGATLKESTATAKDLVQATQHLLDNS
jgi:hypothetical protein